MANALFAITLAAVFSVTAGCARPGSAEGAPAPIPSSDVSMVEVAGEGAQYWPVWRGPTRQGLVPDEAQYDYVDRWSPTENVLWKTEVPGRGHSSPILWDDTLFLTTAYDGGRRRSVLAFDRETGAQLWETFVPDADPERAYAKNSHASSTPTADSERVYAYFGSHGLAALDHRGKIVWHRSFGDIVTRHGTAGSPFLLGDRVVLYQDHVGDSGSFLAALDAKTGETVWWTEREQQLGWGSPVAIEVGDQIEIVINGQNKVMAYSANDGSFLWSCDGSLSEVTPTPVVGAGLVFCSSGRAGPTLAIRPGGRGDVTGTHLAWSTAKGSPFIPSPIVYRDQLYLVNDMASVATSMRAADGELLWQGRMGEAQRESFSASPVALGGKVFFTNDQGETFVLRAGSEFEILHVNRLDEPVLASPALVEGVWYVRGGQHLWAFGEPR